MKRFLVVFSFIIMLIPNCVYALGEDAKAITIMDTDNGRVLYGKNQNDKMLIASITKIMTAIVTIESGKLDEIVIVDDEILKAYGSGIYVQIGEQIPLIELVYGLMLRSGNDAALVIAKHVSGSVENFAKLMNSKAKKIGMKNTVFYNPHGLDEDTQNISTSYDMALLSSYAMQNEIYRQISGTKKRVFKSDLKTYVWNNKNKLLSTYEFTTGGKTGFTDKARRTLVTTASKNNLNMTIVTLNDPSDFKEHEEAYEYVFNNYTKYRILNKNKFKVKDNKFGKRLYIKNDFYYTIKDLEKDKFALNVKLEKNKYKIQNNIAGIVEVLFNNKVVHEEYIYMDTKTENKGWFEKILGWFK